MQSDGICHISPLFQALSVKARPLPDAVTAILVDNADRLKFFHEMTREAVTKEADGGTAASEAATATREQLEDVYGALAAAFADAGEEWAGTEKQIVSFGPRQCGPNILHSSFGGLSNHAMFTKLGVCPAVEIEGAHAVFADFCTTFVNAFQQVLYAVHAMPIRH